MTATIGSTVAGFNTKPARPEDRQRGVALLTVLLVVALATIAAVAMMSQQQLSIRRSANVFDADQARLYALGAELWARQILRQDRRHGDTDHPGELWASELPPTLIEGGSLRGRLYDLQGRFNLNNLVDAEGKPVPAQLERLQRLLSALELPPGLAQAALDWIDPDIEPSPPDGAEDGAYLRLQPAYRAANRRFIHPSELRLLAELDTAQYQRLQAEVCALPARGTPTNINTLSQSLLQSLFPQLTPNQAETLWQARPRTGYRDVGEFLQHPLLAGLEVDPNGLGVASEYFLLQATAEVNGIRARLESVLQRQGDPVDVVTRSEF